MSSIDVSQDNILTKIEQYLNITLKNNPKEYNKKDTANLMKGIEEGFCFGAAASWLLSLENNNESGFFKALKTIASWDGTEEQLKNYDNSNSLRYDKNTLVRCIEEITSQMSFLQGEGNISGYNHKQDLKKAFDSIKKTKYSKQTWKTESEILDKKFSIAFHFYEKEFADTLEKLTSNKKKVNMHVGSSDHAAAIHFNGTKYFVYDPNNTEDHALKFSNAKDVANELFKSEMFIQDINVYEFFKNDREKELHAKKEITRYPPRLTLIKDIINNREKNKISIDSKNELDQTSLWLALGRGHMDTANFLLKNKADINLKDKQGNTPLHSAIFNQKNIVQFLLQNGSLVNVKNNNDFTPLHLAVEKDDVESTILLLKKGALVNEKSKDSWTPLHSAVFKGNIKITTLLLKNLAKVNEKLSDGFTPLHLAVEKGDVELATLLLKNGASVNAVNNDWQSPLHLAAKSGNEKLVKLLVDNGADIAAKDAKKQRPYDIAKSESKKIAAMLKPKLPPRIKDKATTKPIQPS